MSGYGTSEARGRSEAAQETSMGAHKSMIMMLGTCFGRAAPERRARTRALSQPRSAYDADKTKWANRRPVLSRSGPQLHRARPGAGSQRGCWSCRASGVTEPQNNRPCRACSQREPVVLSAHRAPPLAVTAP
jgi:hypothetical protein